MKEEAMKRLLFALTAGLVVATFADTSALAQPLLRRLGEALEQRAQDEGVAETRTTARPRDRLGLVGDELEGQVGVVVTEMEKDGAADQAGFEIGDRIVAINGKRVKTLDDMARVLDRRRTGDPLEFVIDRDGAEQKLTVSFADNASDPPPAEADDAEDAETVGPPESRVVPASRPVLGVRVLPVGEELQQRFGIERNDGAVIIGIAPGTPAERYRLPIGAVIVDINGQEITGPEDLEEIIASSQAGDELEIVYYIGQERYRTKVLLAPAGGEAPLEILRRETEGEDGLGLDLEGRLGRGGQRPLLGRLGRALDDIVVEPPLGADGELPGISEMELLREEVELLRREVDLLRRRVDELERQLRR
jgi:predicted metalloprotease with PDZ domain